MPAPQKAADYNGFRPVNQQNFRGSDSSSDSRPAPGPGFDIPSGVSL